MKFFSVILSSMKMTFRYHRTRSTPVAYSPELRTIDATTRTAVQRICCPTSLLTSTGWQLTGNCLRAVLLSCGVPRPHVW